MFRESDYEPPKLHPSFANKPRPIFQEHQHLSSFDGQTIAKQSFTGKQEMPPEIPTTYDTFYDPSNPDADWTVILVYIIVIAFVTKMLGFCE